MPSTPAPLAVRWQSVDPTFVATAQSLRRQARSRGAQRWRIVFEYNRGRAASYNDLFVFLVQQRGQKEKFTIKVPTLSVTRSEVGAAVALTAGYSAGATALNVDGCSPDGLVIGKGEFFTIAGSAKAYMSVTDVTSTAGLATINCFPPLMEDVANNAILTLSDVPFQVSLDTELPEFSQGLGTLIDPFELSFFEVL